MMTKAIESISMDSKSNTLATEDFPANREKRRNNMIDQFEWKKAMRALQEGLDVCNSLTESLEQKLRRLKTLENRMQFELLFLEQVGTASHSNDTSHAWETIDKLQIFIRMLIIQLNKLSNTAFVTYTQYEDPEKKAEHKYQLLDKGVFGIEAYLEGKVSYLKTPILDTKKKALSGNSTKNSTLQNPTYLFQEGITYSLDKLLIDDDFSPHDYTKKTVMFLFSQGEKTEKLPDNDSYNIEHTLNAIVSRTMGGDNANNCRIVLDTLPPKTLPAGTYITMVPQSEPLPSNAQVVSFWKDHLTNLTVSEQ